MAAVADLDSEFNKEFINCCCQIIIIEKQKVYAMEGFLHLNERLKQTFPGQVDLDNLHSKHKFFIGLYKYWKKKLTKRLDEIQVDSMTGVITANENWWNEKFQVSFFT
jgi:hypothetical protein